MKAKEYEEKYFEDCPLTKESACELYLGVRGELKALIDSRPHNCKSAVKEINQKWNSIVEKYNAKFPSAEFGLKRNAIWNSFCDEPLLKMLGWPRLPD